MNGEWCVFDSKFSKEYCEAIVAEANNLPRQAGARGVRNSLAIWVDGPKWR